ncbi:MAG: ABC transporter substrate-binding protein, partial [Chloroflexi bacterium]|nr:ABC transporter substrate-binding protein [Chloroflexota bacterium]
IELRLEKMGSREMYLAVLDGERSPDLMSPASSLQVSLLQDLSTQRFGQPLVNQFDEEQCQSVVESPIVIVAWEERANALWGTDPGADLWDALFEALTNPEGWAAYGRPEWGFVKFSHTDPLRSNSGFQTLVLMTYNYHGKMAGLTSEDILADEAFQQWLIAFEGSITEFGDSTGTYMEEIIAFGPSLHDMVAVYEATAIEQAENARGRYGNLVVYYPPATHVSDHPFCILDADWVTPEQAQAARLFMDMMLSPEAQELALLSYGFRPVDPTIDVSQPGSPLVRYQENGFRLTIPPEVETPSGSVLQTLLDFWSRNIAR